VPRAQLPEIEVSDPGGKIVATAIATYRFG
jgi:hypothetical protein